MDVLLPITEIEFMGNMSCTVVPLPIQQILTAY